MGPCTELGVELGCLMSSNVDDVLPPSTSRGLVELVEGISAPIPDDASEPVPLFAHMIGVAGPLAHSPERVQGHG